MRRGHHGHPAPQRVHHLTVIRDAFSRRCIGRALERYLETESARAALRMAWRGAVTTELAHHSGRGAQYASLDYTNLLKGRAFRISLTGAATLTTTRGKSFMKTLKYEEVHLRGRRDDGRSPKLHRSFSRSGL